MADISMCNSINCPLRESCYRYTAKKGMWQSYMNYEYDHVKMKCDDYWDNGIEKSTSNESEDKDCIEYYQEVMSKAMGVPYSMLGEDEK